MEISFQNKHSDRAAFYDYMLKQTQDGKQLGKQSFIYRQLWVLLILALISALVWGILSNLGVRLSSSLLISLGLFLFLVMLSAGFMLLIAGFKPYYFFGREVLERQEKSLTELDLAFFQLPKTLVLDGDWLEIRNSETLHRWSWGLVDDIGLTTDFIFLYVGKCHVFFIPKRDFASSEDFVVFGKKLVELQKKNKDQPITAGVQT